MLIYMVKGEQKGKFRDVSSRVDSDELESGVLKFWEKEKVFEKSLEQTKDNDVFTFYDGPPYATGKPHYGHILQSAIKDTVLRYKTMRGFHVPRRVGWDCHGLPVETIVEKELGFKSKKDIEQFGIEKFNKKCRKTAFRYMDEFADTLKRVGRWADYENAYATIDTGYMESEWWTFKQLWDHGLVYKAFRSTPYCTRCETPLSNFEVANSYKDVEDTAVYVLLRVSSTSPRRSARMRGANQQLWLLIWTTTPWTLPGNVAVAISDELKYVSVEHDGREIIVARERMKEVFGDDVEVGRGWKTDELLELRYEGLYSTPPNPPLEKGGNSGSEIYRIVIGGHVSADEGTGLVHMATAFGEEDSEIGKKEDLPVIKNVDVSGRFTDDVPQWAGESVFDANPKIVADLEKRGLLFKEEQYTHSYPFCWRCDSPLIYYALDTWFVKIADLKDRMLKINEEKIHWIPKHVKNGRFGKGIESAPDWAVSRNRFWSVPMPVWECDKCGERVCVGSLSELEELSGESVKDMHRPYVDGVEWECNTPSNPPSERGGESCGGTMKRVEEVLDVWFDSASMPYGQWHYPFENKEFVEGGYPADFIAEGIEMTRAWFYVLHVVATALTTDDIGLGKDNPAYKNVIASGLIFAEDGQKLSKKLKNYPSIEPTIKNYGADVLRFYLVSGTSLGEPYRFSEKDMRQLRQNTYMTLWNVYSFFVRYANTHGWSPPAVASSHILDKWILARLTALERTVIGFSDKYEIDSAARAFIPFIDDLSNWYVRRSRVRFQRPLGDEEKDGAFGTLYDVLVRTSKLLAPYMPFVSEEIYQNITSGKSVHLEGLEMTLNELDKMKDQALLDEVEYARRIVAEGLALRAREGIRVRQPLGKLYVKGDEMRGELLEMVADELNYKSVEFVDELPSGKTISSSDSESKMQVAWDIEITPELRCEGLARDIVRHGQLLRRDAGYALDARITLILSTDDDELRKVIETQKDYIMEELQTDKLDADGKEDKGADVEVDGKKVHIGVKE